MERASGRNSLWTRIFRKHGFVPEKIAENLTEKDAFRIEVETIIRLAPLCNFTAGGEGITGYRHTANTKERLHKAHFQRKQTPETIEKRAVLLRGKKRSIEFREAVSARKTGQKHTLETRQKMSIARVGLHRDPVSIEKTASWHRGRKRSDEARMRMSEAQPRLPVICIETGNVFASITEAEKWLKINGHPRATKTGVWMALMGKHQKSYGYTWSRHGAA